MGRSHREEKNEYEDAYGPCPRCGESSWEGNLCSSCEEDDREDRAHKNTDSSWF